LKTARRFGLGFANDGEAAGRIVFPMRCPLGCSWTARAVSDDTRPKYYGGEGAGRLLFGYDVAFSGKSPRELVVCEGPMDVLSLAEAGIAAVAVMSKTINEERAALLRRSGAKLIVALDSDARSAALKVSEALGRAPVVLLDSGDPGDASPGVLVDAVRGALENPDARSRVYRSKIKHLRRRCDAV
jgi:DNA primase